MQGLPSATLRRVRSRRGIAMMVVLQLLVVVLIIGVAFMVNGNTNLFFVAQERNGTQALYAAEAAAERTAKEIFDRIGGSLGTSGGNPFTIVDAYQGPTIQGRVAGTDGKEVATYTVTCTVSPAPGLPAASNDPDRVFLQYKFVALTATATCGTATRRVRVTLKAGLKPSDTFDYSYNMNNWGWWSGGANVVMNGNCGANGNFTVDGATALVRGNPTYNPDGTTRSMAAISASMNIALLNGATITGYGGDPAHRQERAQFSAMPNLNNADYWKNLALGNLYAPKGTLRRGATTLVNGALTGTRDSIVLDGTSTPIQINGPVYVPGNVVIKGTVTGQGTLYVGRNLYVAGDVTYANAPSTRPIYDPSTQSPEQFHQAIETWKADNQSKDAVAFAVRKNVVTNDVTDPNWWTYFGNNLSLADPLTGQKVNDNHEDAGTDRIWSSLDSKENDNVWTVQVRDNVTGTVSTQNFPVTGGTVSIPSDVSVIPGTGEDVDGDGKYTQAYTSADFTFADSAGNPISFSSTGFANCPAGGYAAFVRTPGTLHGFLYTNGAVVGSFGQSNQVTFRGGMTARQDAMTGATNWSFEHDERMTGVDQQKYGLFLPPVQGVVRVSWAEVTGL